MDWGTLENASLNQAWVQAALGLGALLLVSYIGQWVARHILARGLARLGAGQRPWILQVLLHPDVLDRAAQIVPTLIVQLGIRFVPHLPAPVATVIGNVAAALTVLCVARTLFRMLSTVLLVHDHSSEGQTRSIKSFVQLAQLLVGVAAVVIMIASLADKSPLIVLSGFGAMSAVLMLIFQDTIKSFTAGVLVEGNDLMRVGDWVEMPQADADGEVIDIALNTVKIQNWDMTIVTIPTWRFMSESFKNWRGMSDSGGRRIKRTLMIDAGSIRFLNDEEIDHMGRIALIADYVAEKENALQVSRSLTASKLGKLASEPANQRRLTNIGTFRQYAAAYLRASSSIHKDMTLMVRMMQPTPQGVPMEIYCFTTTTEWVAYEGIQSDIFDHLLAILPEFGLRAFQSPGGADVMALGSSLHGGRHHAPADLHSL